MRIITLFLIIIFTSGCVGDNCFRTNGAGVNSDECREYRNTHPRPSNPGIAWHEYVLFPIFVLLAAGSSAAEIQRDVVSNPHYQAGSGSYVDYAAPVSQPTTSYTSRDGRPIKFVPMNPTNNGYYGDVIIKQRDAYGPGIHMDQYGRAIKEIY